MFDYSGSLGPNLLLDYSFVQTTTWRGTSRSHLWRSLACNSLEYRRGDHVRPFDHGAVDHIQVGFRPAEIVGSFVARDLPRVRVDG